jgi:hypothetical protein
MSGKRFLAVGALAALAAATAGAVTPDYFPLAVGNVWAYRAGDATQTAEVVRTVVVDNTAYSVVQGLFGDEVWLHMAEDGTLEAWDPVRQQKSVWAAFGAPEGTPYATSVHPCDKTAQIASRNARYSGPVGEFSNALRIVYPPGTCADAGVSEDLFLPYVGLVSRTFITIAGPQRYDLIYARLGGVTEVSEQQSSFELALDRAVYTADLMPPVDPRRSIPVMTARIKLRNTQDQPLVLDFASGQIYDLELKAEDGKVVYRWSDGRMLTQALQSLTVPPRTEKVWVIVVRLGNSSGVFPQGRYTAEAWLTTTGSRKWFASVPFEIRHVF